MIDVSSVEYDSALFRWTVGLMVVTQSYYFPTTIDAHDSTTISHISDVTVLVDNDNDDSTAAALVNGVG